MAACSGHESRITTRRLSRGQRAGCRSDPAIHDHAPIECRFRVANRSGAPVRVLNIAAPGGYEGYLIEVAAELLAGDAADPVRMAEAFALAVEAGRLAYAASPMEPRDMAAPSTPVVGKANLA